MKKSIIFLATTIIILTVAYLLYDVVMSWLFPCRGIFEQTAPSLKSNMKIVKIRGEIFIGKEKIQELTERSQKTALKLKTCCILLHEGLITSEEFMRCKESARSFEMDIQELVRLLDEAQIAKQQEKFDVVNTKLEQINRVLSAVEKISREFREQIKPLPKPPADEQGKPGLPSRPVTEVEPNNSYTQAMEIPMGVLNGELTADDADYFKFDVPNGHILKLAFTPHHERNYTSIFLRNSERSGVWNAQNVPPEVTRSTRVMMNTTSGGTYYVIVSGGRGQYEFELSIESQNDAGSGNDAGDKITKALKIEPGRSFRGEKGGFDKEDWYNFDIPNGHILKLAFTPHEEAESVSISLLNFERKTVWRYSYVAPGVTKSTRVMMGTSSGGTYYVCVYDGSGQYQFELTTESQNDAGSGNDAGDKITEALKIGPGQSFPGEIGGLDEQDFYEFSIPNGHVLNLAFTPNKQATHMDVYLRNSKWHDIWGSQNVDSGTTISTRKMMNTTSGGTYYVLVCDGSGQYQFELTTESQNDAGSGNDAGDKITEALKIGPGQSFPGEIGGLDGEDWYTFSPVEGRIIKFTPDVEASHMDVYLLDFQRQVVWSWQNVDSGTTKSFKIPKVVMPPYYIKICDGSGKYTFEVK